MTFVEAETGPYRKTPPSVPAYRIEGVRGLMTTLRTFALPRPVFIAVQVVPLCGERKTPRPSVPAYMVAGGERVESDGHDTLRITRETHVHRSPGGALVCRTQGVAPGAGIHIERTSGVDREKVYRPLGVQHHRP